MLLKLDEPRLLTESISVISELVSEVKAKINKEGINIIAFDPANVSLVELNMPASIFSQFDVEKEEILGLNLDDLKSVLRRVSADSSIIIKKDSENMLHLEIKGKVQRNFSLALIENNEEAKKKQKLDFESKIEMDSSALTEAINDASVVSDACTFISKKDSFAIEAKGSINKSRIEFTSNDAKLQTENSKSKYSLEYLQKFIKAAKISDKVVVNFSTNYPLQLDFKDKVSISFILAPRVEEED